MSSVGTCFFLFSFIPSLLSVSLCSLFFVLQETPGVIGSEGTPKKTDKIHKQGETLPIFH